MASRTRYSDLPRLFFGTDAIADGVLTPNQLRGPHVHRVIRGIYRPAQVPDSHLLRCQAVAMTLPAGAMFTGRTAATARGVALGSLADPIEILCHEDVRAGLRRGVLVRRMRHLPRFETVDDLPLAPAYRMAYDLAARQALAEGVADVDAVARHGLVDLEGWRAWLADQHGHHVLAARAAAELADPRAESRPESLVRVALVRAGLDVEPQYVVRHAGRFVARVDLAIVRWRLAIEYDGAWHALRSQLERDRARLNALREADWRTVHVTREMLADPRDMVEAVCRARCR